MKRYVWFVVTLAWITVAVLAIKNGIEMQVTQLELLGNVVSFGINIFWMVCCTIAAFGDAYEARLKKTIPIKNSRGWYP